MEGQVRSQDIKHGPPSTWPCGERVKLASSILPSFPLAISGVNRSKVFILNWNEAILKDQSVLRALLYVNEEKRGKVEEGEGRRERGSEKERICCWW